MDAMQLDALHEYFWGRQEYGASFAGVVCSSLVKLAGPVLEELTFTGFLANICSRRFGTPATLATVPLLFAAAHIPKYGVGFQLAPVLVAGVALLLVRLLSGRIIYSIAAHIVTNAIALVPGWIEVYLYSVSS